MRRPVYHQLLQQPVAQDPHAFREGPAELFLVLPMLRPLQGWVTVPTGTDMIAHADILSTFLAQAEHVVRVIALPTRAPAATGHHPCTSSTNSPHAASTCIRGQFLAFGSFG